MPSNRDRRYDREDDYDDYDDYDDRRGGQRSRDDFSILRTDKPELPYGDLGQRVIAGLIDGVVLNIVFWPICILAGFGLFALIPNNPRDFPLGFLILLVLLLIGLPLSAALYEIFMDSSSYQGTIGKVVAGLKVTDLKGRQLTTSHAALRCLSKIISGSVFPIGHLLILINNNRQGLHDIIAGTYVLEKNPDRSSRSSRRPRDDYEDEYGDDYDNRDRDRYSKDRNRDRED
jgi:uncharacterized RDD family membrane protein YckC